VQPFDIKYLCLYFFLFFFGNSDNSCILLYGFTPFLSYIEYEKNFFLKRNVSVECRSELVSLSKIIMRSG